LISRDKKLGGSTGHATWIAEIQVSDATFILQPGFVATREPLYVAIAGATPVAPQIFH
jgi:hypothetical protein